MVRKQSPQELYELVVIIDCTRPPKMPELKRLQREDNIIETAVAIAYDACRKKIKTRVVWCTDKLCEIQLDSLKSFDRFYSLSAELPFCSHISLEEAWQKCEAKMAGSPAFWLIGCNVPAELAQKVQKSVALGKEIVLIDTGEEPL